MKRLPGRHSIGQAEAISSIHFIVEILRDDVPVRLGKGLAAIVPDSSSVAITKYKLAGQPLPMLSFNRCCLQ